MTDSIDKKIKINTEFRKDGDASVLSAFDKLQSSIETSRTKINNLQRQAAQMRAELDTIDDDGFATLDQYLEQTRKNAQATQIEFAQLRGEVKATADAAEEAGSALQESASVKPGGSGGSGGIGIEGLRRTGGALSQLGAGELGAGLSRAGDIGQITKEFQELFSTLGANKIGVTQLGAAGLIAAPAIILTAQAITTFNHSLESSRNAVAGAVQAQTQYYELLSKATTEEANAELQRLQLSRAGIQQQLAELQNSNQAAFASASKTYTDLGARIVFAVGNPTQATSEQITKLQTELAATDGTITRVTSGLQTNAFAANDLAEAEKKLADQRKEAKIAADQRDAGREAADINNELNAQIEKQRLLVSGTSDEFEARKNSLISEFTATDNAVMATQKLIDAEQAGSEKRKVYEQQLESLLGKESQLVPLIKVYSDVGTELVVTGRDLLKLTADIVTENQKYDKIIADRVQQDARNTALAAQQDIIDADKERERVQAINDKIADLRTKAADTETTQLANMYARRDQINQQAMDNELKLLANYIKTESRATEDYNRDRVRKLQDLFTSLLDLSGRRDIAAFVSTRRQGLTTIQRGDEDFGTAARRRRQDYEDQVREAENNRRKQLEVLQVSYNQEKALREKNLQDQIAQQEAGLTVQIKQSDRDQQKLADLRAMYAAEDLKARRDAEDKAHNDQVANLTKKQKELTDIISAGLDPLTSPIITVTNTIKWMVDQIKAVVPTVPVSPSGSSVVMGSYASGIDRVPRTGIYQLHAGERVVSAAENRSSDYRLSGGGGRQIILNIGNMNYGEIASPALVRAQMTELVEAFGILVRSGG